MDPLKTPADQAAADNVHDLVEPRRDERLADEFDLVRLRAPVYVLDQAAARKRSKGAERVARHRERQAAAGLVPTTAPADLVEQVKAAGGWPAWQQAQAKAAAEAAARTAPKPAPVPPAPPPAPPVLPPDVEAQMRQMGFEQWLDVYVEHYLANLPPPEPQLSPKDKQRIELGRRVAHLKGWRRTVVYALLGIR